MDGQLNRRSILPGMEDGDSETDQESFEQVTLRVAGHMLMVAGWVFLALLLIQTLMNTINRVNTVAYPVMSITMLMAWLLSRWRPHWRDTIITACVVLVALYIPFIVGLGMMDQLPHRELHLLAPASVMMPFSYLLIFFVFRMQTALMFSAVLFIGYALALVLPVYVLLPDYAQANAGFSVGVILIAQPVYVLMLTTFAWLKQRYESVQVRTDSLEMAADTDGLTQMHNRRRMTRELQRLLGSRTTRPIGLLIFDIDHFKSVNDNHGHQIGDEVLVQMAQTVKSCLREGEIAARWGGEEFLVAMPVNGLEDLQEIGERLRSSIEAQNWPLQLPITASFGASVWAPPETVDQLVDRADRALYSAKRCGRNCVRAYSPHEFPTAVMMDSEMEAPLPT
ncbi:diguanylate cyclase domain-containing protein [Amphibiibacter pelophylacis]|uniref:GGDEF domain-containing protein n=1 Tax=Amphibiibacter pelophylacis TaxID=1799477 RepID=A0ACC6NYB7_9BURK